MGIDNADLTRLHEPFPATDVEWRLQQCGEKNGKVWGKCLAYVTNRAIMERLDQVCGAGNWRNEYKPVPSGEGVLCGLSLRIAYPDGSVEWVTKWDGAEFTDVEATKGGLSGSMKRAGVQWGIGRYLYELDEGWIVVSENGRFSGKVKETNTRFRWDPPALPAWALPGGSGKPTAQQKPSAPQQTGYTEADKQVLREAAGVSDAHQPQAPSAPVQGDVPPCPKCGGRMWDNRIGKRNPKAPDFKCRDRSCDGVIWPPKPAKAPKRDEHYAENYEDFGPSPHGDSDLPF